MKTDTYTKVTLTMIAVLLLLHLIKPVVLPPSVQAQDTMNVRITGMNGVFPIRVMGGTLDCR